MIIAKTEIGRGIPEVAGTAAGHGEGGAKFAESARKGLGLPEETFFVSEEVRELLQPPRREALAAAHADWQATFDAWSAANPDLADELDRRRRTGACPATCSSASRNFDGDAGPGHPRGRRRGDSSDVAKRCRS